ncbi:MAG: hypothetical protein ABI925_07280 [Verrucomicrobiota bacterium]
MWKPIAASLLLATRALAQEHSTAYEALRIVGSQMGRDHVNRVISVSGSEGNPQPETWKILLDDSRARGGVREVEVAGGRVVSERTPVRSVTGSSEGATIKTAHLNLDSSGAFSVASHTAEKSNTQFETASYTLRTDEHGDPVWIVTLENRSRPVGTIYIGANRGVVTRTEGMFSGTTMTDVEVDEVRDKERGHGMLDNAKSRITETFHHAQDDARGMFHKVRRSFADFIAGD